MYTNLPEETKVLTNKFAFAHENNQSNKKSKQGDAWIKFKQREKKNPSIFVAQPVKLMNLKDSKLSVRINSFSVPFRHFC